MSEHVTTCIKGAITSYYSNNKNKSLRDRKSYAKNDIGNGLPVEDGIDGDGGANLKQNVENDPSIDTDKVVVGDKLTTVDIIHGAIVRDNTNPSVYVATYEDLNEFVKCFLRS